jgi:hypothetical protein
MATRGPVSKGLKNKYETWGTRHCSRDMDKCVLYNVNKGKEELQVLPGLVPKPRTMRNLACRAAPRPPKRGKRAHSNG